MRKQNKNKIRWRIPALSPRNIKSKKTPNESQQQEKPMGNRKKRFSNEVRMQKP